MVNKKIIENKYTDEIKGIKDTIEIKYLLKKFDEISKLYNNNKGNLIEIFEDHYKYTVIVKDAYSKNVIIKKEIIDVNKGFNTVILLLFDFLLDKKWNKKDKKFDQNEVEILFDSDEEISLSIKDKGFTTFLYVQANIETIKNIKYLLSDFSNTKNKERGVLKKKNIS